MVVLGAGREKQGRIYNLTSQNPLVEEEVGLRLQHLLLGHLGHTAVRDVEPLLGCRGQDDGWRRLLLLLLRQLLVRGQLSLHSIQQVGNVARVTEGRGEEGGWVRAARGVGRSHLG